MRDSSWSTATEYAGCTSAGNDQANDLRSPTYLAARPPLRQPEDLRAHVVVRYETQHAADHGSAFLDYTDANQSPQSLQVPSRVSVRTAETYIACAIARGDLVEVLPQWRPAPMPVHALYPHRRHLSPRVRAFVAWFKALLQDAQQ